MSTRIPMHRWLAFLLGCVLVACGDEKPAKPAPAVPVPIESEANAPTDLTEEPKAPAPEPLPAAPEPPGEREYAHRDAAAQAGRAILASDLAKAAPHLAWLGHYEYPSKLPPAWQPYAGRTQLAARVLARATTPGEAMRALPALDAACGACHAELAKNADFNATEGPVDHGEGAYALLDGLGGPADKVFARAAEMTPRIKDQDKADRTALKALQDGSARAAKAATWVERLAATEELYAQCGSCHVGLR